MRYAAASVVAVSWTKSHTRPRGRPDRYGRSLLLLSDAGIVVDRIRHEITAEIAGPRNAQLLDTPIGAAVLRVNRLAFVSDAPHHHLSVLLSPSRSRVLLSQTADELETGDGLTIAHDVAAPR